MPSPGTTATFFVTAAQMDARASACLCQDDARLAAGADQGEDVEVRDDEVVHVDAAAANGAAGGDGDAGAAGAPGVPEVDVHHADRRRQALAGGTRVVREMRGGEAGHG